MDIAQKKKQNDTKFTETILNYESSKFKPIWSIGCAVYKNMHHKRFRGRAAVIQWILDTVDQNKWYFLPTIRVFELQYLHYPINRRNLFSNHFCFIHVFFIFTHLFHGIILFV